MKKLLLIIALIFNFTTQILAQNPGPNITWQKCFSTSGDDTFYSLIEIPTGGYYATIELEKKDNFLVNDTTGGYFLVKFNADFNIIWKRFIPLFATEIILEPNGSIILGGLTTQFINKGNVFKDIHGADLDIYSADLALLKLDSTGQKVLWAHAYGSTGAEDQFFDLIPTNNSGFLFSGTTRGSNGDINPNRPCYNPFLEDAVFMKVDSLGMLQWVKTITGSTADVPTGSIVELSPNKYRIDVLSNSDDCDFAGTLPFDYNSKNYRTLSMIIDENGNEFKRKLDGTGKLAQYFAKTWKKGNKIYGVGYAYANVAYNPTFPTHKAAEGLVVVFDDSLNMVNQKLFGGNGYDFFFDHIYDTSGNHIFFGATASSDNSGDITNYKGGYSDYWIVKTDTNFNIVWSRTVGSIGKDSYLYYNFPSNKMIIRGSELILAFEIYPPLQLPNGDVSCGLYTLKYGDSTRQCRDAWMVAFDLTTGIEMIPTKMETNFKLFPNPTGNVITIQNSNPTGKKYKISIADQLGKVVKEMKYEDSNEFTLSVGDLDDGMYFISIQNNKKLLFTQKIMVKK